MKMTRREEVAVGILVACEQAGVALIRTGDAAEQAGVSLVQAAQIVHRLMQAGLLTTVRGKHGGIRLARPAELITLGEVLRASCHSHRAPIASDNPLAAISSAAQAQAAQAFESFSIADIAHDRVGDKLACFECSIRLRALRPAASDRPARQGQPAPPVPSNRQPFHLGV